jgi:two-component system, cell cycle response regulator DivK
LYYKVNDRQKATAFPGEKVFYLTMFFVIIKFKSIKTGIPHQTHADVNKIRYGKQPMDKTKILIAEDDSISIAYLQEVLRGWNMETLFVHNGLDAVSACREKPDIALVLMDIKMPLMGGVEAMTAIKSLRPDLPVIAQTAYALNEERIDILNQGFDGYLSKPIRRYDLLKILKEYLPDMTPAG